MDDKIIYVYDYLTLIGHAALMTLGLAIYSLIVGLLLSIILRL